MTDNADVIQGRLGWERGDISEAAPDELTPHPKNSEIYGDTESAETLDGNFVASVREKGVLEPLVITENKQIVSGHRRWIAAQEAGLESVPVRYADFETELAEREAIIEFNRQREKTPAQIVNEFEEMLEIEKERAKERQGNRNDLDKHSGDVSKKSQQPSREKAAEKVNADVSGRTIEKGKKVKDKATSDDEPEAVQEAAQEAWDGLASGEESFNSAHEKVKDAEENNQQDNDISQFTSQETDEWSSPREIVEPLSEYHGGFDLDPCSGAEQSPFADATYTEADDGLAQDWFGTVWVNPPYSDVSRWVDKAVSEIQAENTDIIYFLCKGDSSTEWWHHAAEEATLINAIDHRLKFGDGENSAPFASHIMVFGDSELAAHSELATNGVNMQVIDNE